MKKTVLLTLLPLLVGCSVFKGQLTDSVDTSSESTNETVTMVSPETMNSSSTSVTKSSEERSASRLDFALDLFKTATLDQSNKSDNLVISPFSAGQAISMLMEGAEGQTKDELQNALCGSSFSGVSPDGGNDVVISSANSLWLKNGFPLSRDYMALMQESYNAQVYQKDFSDKSTVSQINKWCSDNTNGKIPSIIDQIGPDMVMFILNALYFNASWQNEFKSSDTFKQPFHGTKGDVQTEFMHQSNNFAYTFIDGNQVASFPYKGGKYSMMVVLPSKDKTVDEVAMSIDTEFMAQVRKLLRSTKLELSMPKFKIESELLLNSVLMDMGIQKAFTRGADFSAMTSASVAVDQVKQKVFIDVNEKGTEAAAVTSIGVRLTSMRPETIVVEMNINRPFIFFIMDRESDDILFAGNIRTINN